MTLKQAKEHMYNIITEEAFSRCKICKIPFEMSLNLLLLFQVCPWIYCFYFRFEERLLCPKACLLFFSYLSWSSERNELFYRTWLT